MSARLPEQLSRLDLLKGTQGESQGSELRGGDEEIGRVAAALGCEISNMLAPNQALHTHGLLSGAQQRPPSRSSSSACKSCCLFAGGTAALCTISYACGR